LTFILEDNDYRDLDTIELLPLNTKEFTSFSSHLNMDSIYVVTDETVKMFPGLEERFISKTDIPDNLWDMSTSSVFCYLSKNARLGNFLISCISFLEILYLVCGLCSLKLASYDMAIIPNQDVVEPSWKLLCKTLHETVIEENIFYTKQNGGKWITRSGLGISQFLAYHIWRYCIWCVACVL
jgi:hypothetical protein